MQAFLIAITAQFIPLLVYGYRDPDPDARLTSPSHMDDNLQESLGGYVNYSLSEFPIRVLLDDDNHPFPLASAISLNWYRPNHTEPSDYYYQPYHISGECFLNQTLFPGVNETLDLTRDFPLNPSGGHYGYFRESAWDDFTGRYDTDPGGQHHTQYRQCVDEEYPCRYCYHIKNFIC